MSAPSSPLKPAPLSFGRADSSGGRMSPFRRPESPLGRSPSTVRAATPSGSPLKQATPSTFGMATTASSPTKAYPPTTTTSTTATATATADDRSWINSRNAASTTLTPTMDKAPDSPTKSPRLPLASSTNSLAARFESPAPSTSSTARPSYPRTNTASTVRPSAPAAAAAPRTTMTTNASADPLSAIPPHHLHTMRESFAVLDRTNTGAVTPQDLTQQLTDLGLDASPAALSTYFPPGTASLTLASYLNLLSADLTRLGSSAELMDALSTFDADDSGEIDVQELVEALVSTVPEEGERRMTEREVEMVMEGFVGRRAFKRGYGNSNAASSAGGAGGLERKPVFRYGEFVRGIWGGGTTEEAKVEVAA